MPNPAVDSSACGLAAGELEAVFVPGRGMLGTSLKHRGEEILRRLEGLDAAAASGSTAGIPLLHPWANRLAGLRYRAAGREVVLDPSSPLLHFDSHGLPIHGVPWGRLAWEVLEAGQDRLVARLEWNRGELLAIFPFPHSLEMTLSLGPDALTIETALFAGAEGAVPVAFGFHPYVGLPGLERGGWRLNLPAMRQLALDANGIPTGKEEPFGALDALLGDRGFDDGFALASDRESFGISGAGRQISVELLSGYPYFQVYAPKDQDFIALEPMTAPTSALASGRGLSLVEAGGEFRAAFRIRVEEGRVPWSRL